MSVLYAVFIQYVVELYGKSVHVCCKWLWSEGAEWSLSEELASRENALENATVTVTCQALCRSPPSFFDTLALALLTTPISCSERDE